MKAPILSLLIASAALVACNRAETPPAPTPPGPTNTANAAAATAPADATPSAARVALAGVPGGPNAPGNTGKSTTGNLQFITTTGAVQLTGQITGLTPNAEHGFHIHQTGTCTGPDFKSAGEHFNPEGAMHGAPTSAAHHLGDLAAVKADATGTATVSATIADATLNDGGPHDLVGKALIVHAKPDDYKTQPSGNSGDRIACGVIERQP